MSDIIIRVGPDEVSLDAEIKQISEAATGAIATFTGIVRDSGGGLISLTLEHYPGMTEKKLHQIADQACQYWPLNAIRITHRVGRLLPSDMIVFVAASSAHREAALNAVHFIMDYLKTEAPFWKAEETSAGTHWVDARESDDKAKEKWQA